VCADVIGRVVFNSPVKGTPEIVSGSIVMILWLQAAYAIRSGGMIWVDAIHVHLPGRAQRACDVLGALLGIAFFGLVCWGSIEPALYSWRSSEFEGEGALRVPVWPARFLVVLGSFLAAFNYLLLAIERTHALISGTPPPPPTSGISLEERIV
jgi:TRAP-type C4-dicarboxylate transport system permease small subunit